jgi:hypothetical protein
MNRRMGKRGLATHNAITSLVDMMWTAEIEDAISESRANYEPRHRKRAGGVL